MLYFAFWWLIAIKSTSYLGFQDYTLYELTIVNPALYQRICNGGSQKIIINKSEFKGFSIPKFHKKWTGVVFCYIKSTNSVKL